MEYLWLAVAAAALIIEVLTVNLVSVWFIAGAIAAFVASLMGAGFWIQLCVFIVISAILIIAVMPAAKKLVAKSKTATNSDRIIGEKAIVTEKIDNISATGQIKVLGNIWSAKSSDGSIIESGETVIIEKISGVKAIVKIIK